jgi:hypothetical protein
MKANFLQGWIDGRLDGIGLVSPSSVAARAILKYFDPSRHAEFRDPEHHEIYRYDRARNVVYRVV